jgi:hypothetical protein
MVQHKQAHARSLTGLRVLQAGTEIGNRGLQPLIEGNRWLPAQLPLGQGNHRLTLKRVIRGQRPEGDIELRINTITNFFGKLPDREFSRITEVDWAWMPAIHKAN